MAPIVPVAAPALLPAIGAAAAAVPPAAAGQPQVQGQGQGQAPQGVGWSWAFLPPHAPHLTSLVLLLARATEVPEDLPAALPALRNLMLRGSRLSTLPPTFTRLRELRRLDLAGNHFARCVGGAAPLLGAACCLAT